jgi:hypothetical protein
MNEGLDVGSYGNKKSTLYGRSKSKIENRTSKNRNLICGADLVTGCELKIVN